MSFDRFFSMENGDLIEITEQLRAMSREPTEFWVDLIFHESEERYYFPDQNAALAFYLEEVWLEHGPAWHLDHMNIHPDVADGNAKP